MAEDWEQVVDDFDSQVKTVGSKWADEDQEEDVKDSWEDAAESDEESEKKPTVLAPIRKKKTLEQKIKEKEEAEEKKRLERQAKLMHNQQEEEEDAEARRERRQREEQAIREADLRNAEDMFSGVTIKSEDSSEAPVAVSLDNFKPTKKGEFDLYSKALLEKFATFPKSASYLGFLETIFRGLANDITYEDIRKITSTLTALSNEKQKAERDAHKKKKSGKKAQVTVSAAGEMEGYEDNYMDDYDDFM